MNIILNFLVTNSYIYESIYNKLYFIIKYVKRTNKNTTGTPHYIKFYIKLPGVKLIMKEEYIIMYKKKATGDYPIAHNLCVTIILNIN